MVVLILIKVIFNLTLYLFYLIVQKSCQVHNSSFLKIYGVTQDPETKEYMIVMQYANNGSLLSYLDQNINKLTWKMKLEHLLYIARYLDNIHHMRLVDCDLHGGNIVLHDNTREIYSFICDLGLSRSVNSHESNSTIRGVLPGSLRYVQIYSEIRCVFFWYYYIFNCYW